MHGLAYCTGNWLAGWLVSAVFKILISHLANEWETKQSVALFGQQTIHIKKFLFISSKLVLTLSVKPDRLRNSKLVEFQVRSRLYKPLLYFIGILNFLPSCPFPSPTSPSCRPVWPIDISKLFQDNTLLWSNKVSVVTLYNFSSVDWGKACHMWFHLDIPAWRWAERVGVVSWCNWLTDLATTGSLA